MPKASQSSKILYTIYLVLTLLEVFALRIAGMPWFDAVNHALSTAGTGGFSVRNNSIASYASPAIEWVIILFMFLFSINFSMYFLLLCGKVKRVLQSDELRFFLTVVLLATGAIAVNIRTLTDSVGQAIRQAIFQVLSVMSVSYTHLTLPTMAVV